MLDFGKTIFYKILRESTIHGCYHVVVKRRTLIERIFWLFIIIISVLCVKSITSGQWIRYQMNPTVLSIETNYKNWIFKKASATICSNYTDKTIATELIEELWNVTTANKNFNYYNHFVETVATTHYNNLENYKQFINDQTLTDINLLNIVTRIYENIEPPLNDNFHSVITEMGHCFSSTKLHHFQDPFNNRPRQTKIAQFKDDETCRFLDVCKHQIKPDEEDKSGFQLFIHDFNDVLSMPHQPSILIDGYQIEITLSLSVIIASDQLKTIERPRRKCFFFSETILTYFDVYTPNLCMIDCRIKNAINLCGCYPFIYNYVQAGRVCDPIGMYCLSMKKWLNKHCNCPDLCEKNIYSKNIIYPLLNENKVPLIVLDVLIPKTRTIRAVLFNFQDLIVSFGGAAALFLGCSFISAIEIIFIFLEFILIKLKILLINKK